MKITMAVTSNTKETTKKDANKENSSEASKNGEKKADLEIGATITAKRADGSWHTANVVHRRYDFT